MTTVRPLCGGWISGDVISAMSHPRRDMRAGCGPDDLPESDADDRDGFPAKARPLSPLIEALDALDP